MSEHFDKLKSIGIQKIHENTHISRLHVESILKEDFKAMSKIQLLGFISILEREYSLDLDSLKNSAIKYFDDIKDEEDEELEVKVFLVPKRKRNLAIIYIVVAIIIFLSIMFINMNYTQSKELVSDTIDNSAIQNATNYIEPSFKEQTQRVTSDEQNITKETTKKEEDLSKEDSSNKSNNDVNTKTDVVDGTSFKIIPKAKVWLGYIDMATHKKYQKIFEDEFDLNASKNWLLAFGHGRLDIEINGVIKKYNNKKNVRFSYIDGKLQEISLEEFKSLNEGNRW